MVDFHRPSHKYNFTVSQLYMLRVAILYSYQIFNACYSELWDVSELLNSL